MEKPKRTVKMKYKIAEKASKAKKGVAYVIGVVLSYIAGAKVNKRTGGTQK